MSQRLRRESEGRCGGAVARRLAAGTVLVLAPVFWLAPPAAADQIDDLARQLRQLESTVNQLQRYTYRGGAGQGAAPTATTGGAATLEAGPIAARMDQRISALESEIARLTGSFEELDFRLRKVEERLDKLVGDVDFRLRALEGGAPVASAPGESSQAAAAPLGQASAEPRSMAETDTAPEIAATTLPGRRMPGALASANPPPAPPQTSVAPGQPRVLGTISQTDLRTQQQSAQAGTAAAETQVAAVPAEQPADAAVLPPGEPEDQYKYAFQLLRSRQYDEAANALRAFVAAHGDDPLAGNAQYWLGETYYVRGNFADAATAFLAGYQRYPKSSKGPDNLLKLGMALSQLGESEQACRSLSQLGADYPDAPRTITSRAETERSKLKCP